MDIQFTYFVFKDEAHKHFNTDFEQYVCGQSQ